MKETICTIPINDIFMPKDGCPVCRMEKMLEEQYVKFVTGDAMMEPNIRIETNKKGFTGDEEENGGDVEEISRLTCSPR